MSKRKRTSSSPSVPTGNDDDSNSSSEEEEQSRRPPPPHSASLAAPQLPQFPLPTRPPPPRSALHPPPPQRPPPQQPQRRPPLPLPGPPVRRPPPPIQHPLIRYLHRNPVLKVGMPPPPTADSNPDIRPTTSQASPAQQKALTQTTLAAIAKFLEVDEPADLVPSELHGPSTSSTEAQYPPPPPPPDIIDLSLANFLGDENDPLMPQFQQPPPPPAGPAQAAPPPPPAGPRPNKSPEIAPPYPWAGTRRATARPLEYLTSNGINLISGQSRCNICNKIYQLDLDLTRKFEEVSDIVRNQARRYMSWIDDPKYPDCPTCKSKNCLVPVINNPVKKRNVNWLYLLLGQWIACCRNTPQLRYFLKHNGINYPNATSDLQMYLTFLAICKQLCPGDKLFDPCY